MNNLNLSQINLNPRQKNKFVSLVNKKRWLLPVFLFIFIQAAVLAGLFSRPEMAFYDSWFRLRGVQNPGDRVVIVAMDEPSINKLGPFPWPRSVHANLLQKLKEARVVGFDVMFDAPKNPEEDDVFATAIKEHSRVVLANTFSFEQDDQGNLVQVCMMPINYFLDVVAGIGFVNIPTDPDQVVRRITLVDVNTTETPIPSFGLAVALAAKGISPAAIKLSPGQLSTGGEKIPLDNLNRAMPDFWGPRGTFKTISYIDVLEGKISPAFFKDKIVLVGDTTALGHDFLATPYTTANMVKSGTLPPPGVEIHASTIQSFLSQNWYRQVPSSANIIFLFIVGLLTSLFVYGRGPWKGLFGTLAVALVCTSVVFACWQARWWLNLAAPLALILLTYAAMTAADFIQAEMARRRTKAMFSRYVSPDVVEELMLDPDKVSLGGRRQDLTVMFCDIRGFTAYSENKAPEEVVSRLNEYLTAITHVIFRCGGTLDKYLGDGLMAVFGAPVFYPDHIERSILAAAEIQRVIEELNRKWTQASAPPLMVGVGINTGSVLVGNVGSPERMDYTVIGEDVNLASRVEGLTKTFGTLIIISERSVRQLDDAAPLKQSLCYLGNAEVKGFSEPVGVYTIDDK